MNFCADCGTPNLDADAACRACGRSLSQEPTPNLDATSAETGGPATATELSAVASTATATLEVTGSADSVLPPRDEPAASDRPVIAQATAHPPTGAATPSGFESLPPATPSASRSSNALPSFMRPAARAAAAPAATGTSSLLSEHDFPDWIKQIALEDEKKLAAEQQAQAQSVASVVAPGTTMPSQLGRRILPGETVTPGPAPSSWLQRKDSAAASGSAWDATSGPAPARARSAVPEAAQEPPVIAEQAATLAPVEATPQPVAPAAPTLTPTMIDPAVADEPETKPARRSRRGSSRAEVTETAEASAPEAKPKRRSRRGSSPMETTAADGQSTSSVEAVASDSTSRASAGGSRRVYLIAAILLVALLAVAMQLL